MRTLLGLATIVLIGAAAPCFAEAADCSTPGSCPDNWSTQAWQEKCDSGWNQHCTSNFPTYLCLPSEYTLCGYTAHVDSSKHGQYGIGPPQKNCALFSLESEGSENILDRWGGNEDVSVELRGFSMPPGYVVTAEMKKNFCYTARDPNIVVPHAQCVGVVLMCNGTTPCGVCASYSDPGLLPK
jgi:hypothetical protein